MVNSASSDSASSDSASRDRIHCSSDFQFSLSNRNYVHLTIKLPDFFYHFGVTQPGVKMTLCTAEYTIRILCIVERSVVTDVKIFDPVTIDVLSSDAMS